jgi:colanic acid biosynthesis glycosyl transferase WcaI
LRRPLQQHAQDFLAHARVAGIVRAPGASLAPIAQVAGVDALDPVKLPLLVRVLFLTHYYPPEVGAAPARIAALARGLAERGLEVSVHTGFPHYPSGTIEAPYRNRPLTIERDGPVRVLRSAVYPTPNRGFARRLANHLAFATSALATSPAAGPIDVVVAETPPLFTAAAGVAYARLKGAALALNVSDLWPESAIELGALSDGRAAASAHALARLCYRRARLITAPTRGIVESLAQRPEARGKVAQVPPAVDLERFAAIAQRRPRAGAPLRVLYAGTLGIAQGVGVLLEAAAIAGPSAVELTIAGDGPDAGALREQARAERLENVRLLGSVNPTRIPELYESTDAAVVPLRDLPIFAGALPTKLFEALAAARPVIVATRGEAAELVEQAKAGLAIKPGDPDALAAAFEHLRRAPEEALQMGHSGRRCAGEFDRVAVIEQWYELIEGLSAAGR